MDSGNPPNADFTIPQAWERYTPEDHARWALLYERQTRLLPGRACDEYLAGLKALDLNDGGIPHFDRLNEKLQRLTGWRVVAVPHLVPDDIFFAHLANRRFPAGRFIRAADQLDYLQEPDVFHDVFGHVPMLTHPVFADYMQAYGQGGLRSVAFGGLKMLARLYWYTVEFGLVASSEGLRIYGSGIVSSFAESRFALESPSPSRVAFDLRRVMRTEYRIDDFQQIYFVIDGFDSLLAETYQDFAPIYGEVGQLPQIAPGALIATDTVLNGGTQEYAAGTGRGAADY